MCYFLWRRSFLKKKNNKINENSELEFILKFIILREYKVEELYENMVADSSRDFLVLTEVSVARVLAELIIELRRPC